jgi:hypothetical protein
MSLILVLLEIPNAVENDVAFQGIATFAVKARLFNDRKVHQALAITDGVASDRFIRYGTNLLGREGAKQRKVLVEFLRSRQGRGRRLFLKMLAPRGRVGVVVFDPRAAAESTLGQLRRKFKSFRAGDVIEVVEADSRIKPE